MEEEEEEEEDKCEKCGREFKTCSACDKLIDIYCPHCDDLSRGVIIIKCDHCGDWVCDECQVQTRDFYYCPKCHYDVLKKRDYY
jgi:hypothetical protein